MATRNYTIFPHMWTVRRISQSYGKTKYTFESSLYYFPTKEDAEKAIKSFIDDRMIRYKSAKTYKTKDGYTCVDIERIRKCFKYKAVMICSVFTYSDDEKK